VQRFLGQQPDESGAIDEEIAVDLFAAREFQRFDEAVFCAQPHIDDTPLSAAHAAPLGVGAQVRRNNVASNWNAKP
jgi:hypothetical protein